MPTTYDAEYVALAQLWQKCTLVSSVVCCHNAQPIARRAKTRASAIFRRVIIAP